MLKIVMDKIDRTRTLTKGMFFEIDGELIMVFQTMEGLLQMVCIDDGYAYSERDFSGVTIDEVECEHGARFIEVKSLTIN